MNQAQQQHEQQRLTDKKHHEGRVAWLTGKAPIYSCGTPVSKSEKEQMLNASRECLRLINNHGMSVNSASV